MRELITVLAISSLPNLYLGYSERFLEKERRVSKKYWRATQGSGSELNIDQGTTLTSEVLVSSNTTGPARVANIPLNFFCQLNWFFKFKKPQKTKKIIFFIKTKKKKNKKKK